MQLEKYTSDWIDDITTIVCLPDISVDLQDFNVDLFDVLESSYQKLAARSGVWRESKEI